MLTFALVLFCGVAGVGTVMFGFYHFGKGLPEVDQLAEYEPPVMTRVHAADGRAPTARPQDPRADSQPDP